MKRPVRVLLLIDSLTPEAGTENQVVEMIRHMDRTEVELFIACLEDGDRLQSLAPFARPLVFPAQGIWDSARQMLRLRQAINHYAIDVVHTFMIRSAILGVLAARTSRARAILTSRRNMGYWYTPGLLRTFRLLNRMTTRVVANSEGARDAAVAAEGLDPKRVDVIYNGVDLQRFERAADPGLRQRLGIPPQAPVVGIVANYRPVKNHAMFLRAAQLISQRVPEAVFLLVGRGPLQTELQQQAQELGIAGQVFFTSDLGDVAAFYPLLQVACLTSHSEGFSNAILEYMAAGLPVAATSVGGIPETVDHGHTGFLVPPDDAAALADAVSRLLLAPEQARAMGRLGRQRCQRFDLGHVMRQIQDYYRQFLPR